MSFSSCNRKSIVLEQIEADCDLKQWHQDNFSKIKCNKFDCKEWIQPSCDHRTYKYLELLNGMKVLLIYDNKQERKSCNAKDESLNDYETNGNNYYNVSLCVNRGYFSDFAECAGIAHYCEHMIFMGNSKYRKENEWEDWLSLKGGSANASTCNIATTYVFDIAPKGKQLLFEALDRFAHNFICPLFNPDSSQRELNAIESEFNLQKTNDAYRQWLILKHNVMRSHDIPYYKFGSGNKKTLNIEDINDKLMQFYHDNYHPDYMSLVILSDVDLNVLQPYVIELFEAIKKPQLDPADDEKEVNDVQLHLDDDNMHRLRLEPNLLSPIYGTLFRINSVKEHYTLDIYWMLNGNECNVYYDSSPTTFISELLGHEGVGSLHCVLNGRNWINSLECGYDDDVEGINSQFELFEMNFDLTEDGYDHIYDIIDYVFQYLSMLKQTLLAIINNDHDIAHSNINTNNMNDYFIERKRLGDIAFNFSNNTNGWDYVQCLSLRMHQYPIHHLLSCQWIYWHYDPLLLLNALNELTPDRCCAMLLSIDAIHYKHKTKQCDPNMDRMHYTEPILETKYSKECIPKSYLQKWNQYMDTCTNTINKNVFHLPHKNTFIASNLNLISDAILNKSKLNQHFLDIEKKERCGPELLVYNECMKLYYKLDRTYFMPKSYITIAFEHHAIWSEDGKYTSALCILINTFDQYFSKYAYAPTVAGLDFELTQNWRGFKLRLNGYSEQLYPYFKQLLHEFKTFKLNSQLFETQRKAFIRGANNSIIDCEDHLPYIGRKCIVNHSLTIENELIAATKLSINDVEYVRSLLFEKHNHDLRIYGLFMGNMEANTVYQYSQYIMHCFNLKRDVNQTSNDNTFLSPSDQRSIRLSFSKCQCKCVYFPQNTVSLYREVCVSRDEDNNGVSIVFAMSDESVDDDDGGCAMLYSLLRNLLCEAFYDSMRTKQQLGYDVSVAYETVCNIPFLKFQIISSQYNPHYLTLQILKFINDMFYNEYILDILQHNHYEKLKETIDSGIRSRQIECSSLSSRHNMYWSEIFTYNTLQFDAKVKEVKELKQITFEQIKHLYDDRLLLKNKPRCLILQIWTQQDDVAQNHSGSIQQLQEQIRTDLKLPTCKLTEIHSIIPWQNTLTVSPSYL